MHIWICSILIDRNSTKGLENDISLRWFYKRVKRMLLLLDCSLFSFLFIIVEILALSVDIDNIGWITSYVFSLSVLFFANFYLNTLLVTFRICDGMFKLKGYLIDDWYQFSPMFLKIFIPIYFHSQAFEQVKRSSGPVFGTTGDIDIDKIRNSKYFQALKPSKEKDCNQLVRNCSWLNSIIFGSSRF